MKVTTCQIGRTKTMQSQGWMVIDITYKTGVKAFAPRKDMVWGYLYEGMTEEQYTKEYRQMMRLSYKRDRCHWMALLRAQKVCLACYCPKGEFCHRHLLAGYLKLVGDKLGYSVEIIPE